MTEIKIMTRIPEVGRLIEWEVDDE